MKTNDEIKKLREKYIVVQKTNGDDSFYITERNSFATVNLCDCFDNNGFKIWKENNETHTDVEAWTYWDGCNYKTIILRSEMGFGDVIEIDDEKQNAVLSEMPEYPIMNKAIERIETENYMYIFTRFAGDPFHCEVYEK